MSTLKEWKTANKDSVKRHNQKYYEANREAILAKNKEYRLKNPEKILAIEAEYKKKNIGRRIGNNLRSRLYQALKVKKCRSAIKYLGCTIEEFKLHLEKQFSEGMTWKNWGKNGWHIDHKIPLAKFDLSNETELVKACHYTNLQPLWALDNLRKGAK